MTILARVDNDYKSLRRYFIKLFEVLQQTRAEDRAAPVETSDAESNESSANHNGISHLVKPDMVINVYSLVDYWMQAICKLHKREKGLNLSHGDIRGNNDLNAYWKYLTRCAELNLDAVQSSYQRLSDLRKVRNRFIHGGGYVPDSQEDKFSRIDGVTLQGSLIIIDDDFIWDTLDHANQYLSAAASI